MGRGSLRWAQTLAGQPRSSPKKAARSRKEPRAAARASFGRCAGQSRKARKSLRRVAASVDGGSSRQQQVFRIRAATAARHRCYGSAMKTMSYAAALVHALLSLCACSPSTASEPPPQVVVAPAAPSDGAPAASPAPPRGKRAPCSTDQSCNGDPSVSALWGHCLKERGVCECNVGFELHPAGYCQPIAK